MAKIGLNNFRYAKLTEAQDGTPTYDGAKKPAKAISCNVDVTNNSAELYADDGLAESDYSFNRANVTMGIDDDDPVTMADLLGHELDSNGVMVRNANDVAPYVGLGRVIVKMVNNVRKYKVEFLYKVKFSEPSQSDNTKGENLEFGTSELSGIASILANGDWSITKTFDNKADAITYLESLMSSENTATVTFDANGGSGTVAAVVAYIGQTIKLPDGTGITPPSGKELIGWDTTSSATIPDFTEYYRVNGNVTLYAIYANPNA